MYPKCNVIVSKKKENSDIYDEIKILAALQAPHILKVY